MRSFFVVPTVQFYVVLSHAMVAQELAITEVLNGVERERDDLKNGLRGTARRSSRKLAPRMHYVGHRNGSRCYLITMIEFGACRPLNQQHALPSWLPATRGLPP